MMDALFAPMELKLAAGGEATGEIEGYGSVFGNRDSHGDVILPGAFGGVLAQHKAAGTMPTLYVMHGPALGGSLLPDGIWTAMEEDSRGLKMAGRISALDTDHGRRIHALVRDKALRGMSIGFQVGAGNAVMGKNASEPKRQIKNFANLYEVSLVTNPSNAQAQVTSVKALMGVADKGSATDAVRAALALHASSMAGGDSPTAAERAELLTHLQDAHEALTGQRMPPGTKTAPSTLREFEAALREMGFSHSKATELATGGFKSALRDGASEPAVLSADVAAAFGGFDGFTLPKF